MECKYTVVLNSEYLILLRSKLDDLNRILGEWSMMFDSTVECYLCFQVSQCFIMPRRCKKKSTGRDFLDSK